jgi:hypothetical protein
MRILFVSALILVSQSALAGGTDVNTQVDHLVSAIDQVRLVTVRDWDQTEDVIKTDVCDAVIDFTLAAAALKASVIVTTQDGDRARNTVAYIESADQRVRGYCAGDVSGDPNLRIYTPAEVVELLEELGALAQTLKT